MSFEQKILSGKSANIFLVMGNDRGLPSFHYLRVEERKLSHFKSLSGEKIELTDFGTVLESGYGTPNNAVRERMEKEYGFIEAL
jgi:hypothetical protein